MLLVAALALMLLEAKFGGHGALAIAGIVCLTFGTLTLVAAPMPEMGISPGGRYCSERGFGAITVFLVRLAVRARKHEDPTGRGGAVGAALRQWSRLRPRAMCWWRERSGGQWRVSRLPPGLLCG